MGRRAAGGAPGQATIELLGVLPLAIAIVLAVFQLLAARAAHELAGNAAGAGAAAVLQGLDPEDAARDAVPGWSRSRVSVEVRGDEVHVRLRPVAVVPGAADVLVADARARVGEAAARTRDPDSGALEFGDGERTERMRPGAGGGATERRP